MTLRLVNSAILVLTLLLLLTGGYGIIWRLQGWVYEAHRIAAWALIALIPLKIGISARSLGRGVKPNFDRGLLPVISLLLSGMALFVIVLGLMWAWRLGPEVLWLRETVISWHWILALVLFPPLLLHTWRRWPRPKRAEFLDRRTALKALGLGGLGLLGWQLSAALARARQHEDHVRAISGSRLNGYLTSNDFPVTNSAGDGRQVVDLANWELAVSGAAARPLTFRYDEVLALSTCSKLATLDCTVGWYSVQRWRGVPLAQLLELVGAAEDFTLVTMRAVEGYAHNVTPAEAEQVLLATHVGGEPLAHVHGFPMRAVVPSRRGWFWVKWLAEVEIVA